MNELTFPDARERIGSAVGMFRNYLVADHSPRRAAAYSLGYGWQLPEDNRPAAEAGNFIPSLAGLLKCSVCGELFRETQLTQKVIRFDQVACSLCIWVAIEAQSLLCVFDLDQSALIKEISTFFEQESEETLSMSTRTLFLNASRDTLFNELESGVHVNEALETAYRTPKKSWFMALGLDPRGWGCEESSYASRGVKTRFTVTPNPAVAGVCLALDSETRAHQHFVPIEGLPSAKTSRSGLGMHLDIVAGKDIWLLPKGKNGHELLSSWLPPEGYSLELME